MRLFADEQLVGAAEIILCKILERMRNENTNWSMMNREEKVSFIKTMLSESFSFGAENYVNLIDFIASNDPMQDVMKFWNPILQDLFVLRGRSPAGALN